MKNAFVNAVEASKKLEVSLATIYRLVSQRRIQYYKPTGGRLYFRESDLDEFIESGRVEVV